MSIPIAVPGLPAWMPAFLAVLPSGELGGALDIVMHVLLGPFEVLRFDVQ